MESRDKASHILPSSFILDRGCSYLAKLLLMLCILQRRIQIFVQCNLLIKNQSQIKSNLDSVLQLIPQIVGSI